MADTAEKQGDSPLEPEVPVPFATTPNSRVPVHDRSTSSASAQDRAASPSPVPPPSSGERPVSRAISLSAKQADVSRSGSATPEAGGSGRVSSRPASGASAASGAAKGTGSKPGSASRSANAATGAGSSRSSSKASSRGSKKRGGKDAVGGGSSSRNSPAPSSGSGRESRAAVAQEAQEGGVKSEGDEGVVAGAAADLEAGAGATEGTAPAAADGEGPTVAGADTGEAVKERVEHGGSEEDDLQEEIGDAAAMQLAEEEARAAAAAAEIEGFDDDFKVAMAPTPPPGQPLEPDEAAAQEDTVGTDLDRPPDVELLIEEAQEERERFHALNLTLQRRCSALMTVRKVPDRRYLPGSTDGYDVRYNSVLRQWTENVEELHRVGALYEMQVEELTEKMNEKQSKAQQIRGAYRAFKVEVARTSENSRTGKPIPAKVIHQLEEQGKKKEEEVERMHLKSIQLRNQLKKLEHRLWQKEELAEGLHLIDFEQLKIENQSLNEKIEERNEDLLKLRKKTTMTVQVLTHLREKLQHVHKDTEARGVTLEEVERKVQQQRDMLQRIKRERDTLRLQNKQLKEKSGLVTQATLLADMEKEKEVAESLREQVGLLKQHRTVLSGEFRVTSAGNTRGSQRRKPGPSPLGSGSLPRPLLPTTPGTGSTPLRGMLSIPGTHRAHGLAGPGYGPRSGTENSVPVQLSPGVRSVLGLDSGGGNVKAPRSAPSKLSSQTSPLPFAT